MPEGGRRLAGALVLVAVIVAGWAASTAFARTAHFSVTISVSGPGHVTGNGDGGSFNCPDSSCSAMIRERTLLTLTATADEGSTFTGWGGSCTEYGSQPSCTLSITGPKDVTAGFGVPAPPPTEFNLLVVKSGTGSGYVGGGGGIDCGPTCFAPFAANSQTTLIPVADDGSIFVGWSGAGCSGTSPCTVTVASNTTVTAQFDHVDRDAPHLTTLPATAARGTIAQLRFRVYDDSFHSREAVTIMRGKLVVARVTVPLQHVHYRVIYTAGWPVPKRFPAGTQMWCAVATDAAGNASKRSCSMLRIT
jgi:hypothetical protein